jgi:hypothetical protein
MRSSSRPRSLADGRPSTLELIVLDERLAGVANREGFALVV